MASSKESKDHWDAKAYDASASFVPRLTTTVLQYLDPKPDDRILDLGCGDGVLTSQIASMLPTGHILGLDASASMIQSARETYGSGEHPNSEYRVQDCTRLLETEKETLNGSWDKVFSNAALHWILRNTSTRASVFQAAHAALKPGGKLVFEMGGHGNVAEMYTVFITALTTHGVPIKEAQDACQWFFPSETWMRGMLTDAGFEIERLESEYRPTKMTKVDEKGNGGLPGWVRLMGAAFLEKVDERRREDAVKWICDVLEPVVTRPEDGSQWIGYVRLRAIARKT